MSRRIRLLSAVIAALALVAAACGGGTADTTTTTSTTAPTGQQTTTTAAETTTTTEAPMEPVTITLWHGWKENEIESLNEVITAFQAANPDVIVETLFVPFDDLQNKVETAWGSGEGPTLVIGATDWAGAFRSAEFIDDHTGLVSQATLDSLNPAALDAVDFDGFLAGLPQTLKGVVMFRNAALLPEAPATLDDLVAAGSADLERGFFFSMAHLLTACGGTLANEDGTAAFNDDAGVCWLELLSAFEDAGPTEYYTDNDVNLFKAGEVAVIIDGTWNSSDLAASIGAENLAIDPWPTAAQGTLGGVVQTESIYIGNVATDDELAAAGAFVDYFLGAEAQTTLADPTKAAHIPVVAGVEVSDPLLAGAVAAFATSPAQPRFGGCYWGNMDSQLQTYFEGVKDAATALQDAADAINEAVAADECA